MDSSVNRAVFSRNTTTTGKEQGMVLSDNDIRRIVDRLWQTLPQILQNQSGNQALAVSNECIRTTQSSTAQTALNSPALTEAAALPQLFRRPSYVQRQKYSSPYQRLSRRSTATTTRNRPSGTNSLRTRSKRSFCYQILSWTMCQEPARSCLWKREGSFSRDTLFLAR